MSAIIPPSWCKYDVLYVPTLSKGRRTITLIRYNSTTEFMPNIHVLKSRMKYDIIASSAKTPNKIIKNILINCDKILYQIGRFGRVRVGQ